MEQTQLTANAPYFTICHASEPEIDVEVCAPIPFDRPVGGDAQAHTLNAVETMTCTIHHGPFTGLITAFTGLIRWIDTNGFTIVGPDREIYLRLPEHGQYHSDTRAITELQIPVGRKAESGQDPR